MLCTLKWISYILILNNCTKEEARDSPVYMEKLGTVVFEGRLYNLDNMSVEELERLLNTIESRKTNVMDKIEKFVEAGESNG